MVSSHLLSGGIVMSKVRVLTMSPSLMSFVTDFVLEELLHVWLFTP